MINRPSGFLLKRYGALGGCLKLKKWSACLFIHSLQNRKTDRPVAQNARTPPGHERFAFDDPRRLGTTRRVTTCISNSKVAIYCSLSNTKTGDQVQATRPRLFDRPPTYLFTPMAHSAGASNCIVGALGSHPFTSQKKTLCSTTRAPTTVDNRANTASTAYCGYHTKSLNTDDTQSSNSTVTNVEFSAPRVVTSTLRATLS